MTERTEYIPGVFERLGVIVLRASLLVAELTDKIRNPARQAQWAAQYPVYSCPWTEAAVWSVQDPEGRIPEPCGHTWDRRKISTEDLRAEVWDHMTLHLPGEHGLGYASRIVSTIMEGP